MIFFRTKDSFVDSNKFQSEEKNFLKFPSTSWCEEVLDVKNWVENKTKNVWKKIQNLWQKLRVQERSCKKEVPVKNVWKNMIFDENLLLPNLWQKISAMSWQKKEVLGLENLVENNTKKWLKENAKSLAKNFELKNVLQKRSRWLWEKGWKINHEKN